MFRLALSALLAASLTWLVASPAAACSCAEPPPPAEALAGADVVFEGRAVAVELVEPDPSGLGTQRWQFSVTRYFKGELGPTLTLTSPSVCCVCGRQYPLDVPFVVYARMSEQGALRDSMCSSSHALPFEPGEAAALGDGTPPDANLAADDDPVGSGIHRVPVAAAEPAPGCAASLSSHDPSSHDLSSSRSSLTALVALIATALCARRRRSPIA